MSLVDGNLYHTTHCARLCVAEPALYVSLNKSQGTERTRFSELIL